MFSLRLISAFTAATLFACAFLANVAPLFAQLPPELAAPKPPDIPPAGSEPQARIKPKQRAQANTEQADRELREIVADQQAIFAAAEAARERDKFDPDNFRSQMQQLTRRYDRLLRVNPNYVPGCVAYGLLLSRIGMTREGAAFMYKANELDDQLPVVKNQLGNFCIEEGRPLEAFVFYNAAIALEPREPLYYYQLGTLLAEARDIFLKDAPGMWTRAKIDRAMQAAFLEATELAPGDWRYAYRYGLSFYDIEMGEWEAALQFWNVFETKLKPGIEQQVCRLHQAKVLGKLRRIKDAQAKLDTVTANELMTQKMAADLELDALRKKGVVDQSEPAKEEKAESQKTAPPVEKPDETPKESSAPEN